MSPTRKSLVSPTPTGKLGSLRILLQRTTGSEPSESCVRGRHALSTARVWGFLSLAPKFYCRRQTTAPSTMVATGPPRKVLPPQGVLRLFEKERSRS